MIASPHVTARINLARVRENVAAIKERTRVEVWPVIKADGYGLGAEQIVDALRDLADGFCVFALREAVAADVFGRTGKPTIVLGPPEPGDIDVYRAQHVRPAVSSVDEAALLRETDPILAIDTGMQRFACPASAVDETLRASGIREAFTHATQIQHVEQLLQIVGTRQLKLHAAATALLDEPRAWLNAVRPGLACYRGAVRVSTRLLEARDSRGPVGYTGFVSETARHGVILAGYSNGLRRGPCLVNGQLRRIMEIGMQSSYVELGPDDRAGDEVVLLGDGLTEADVAGARQLSEHQTLLELARSGQRSYVF